MFSFVKRPMVVLGQMCRVTLAAIAISGLGACGGGGGEAGGGSGPVVISNKVFVADSANSAIASSANTNPTPGTMVLNRVIAGANTGLTGNVFGLAIDAVTDRLYVANGTSILVFNNAGTASGNTAPARTITRAGTSFGNVSSLFLDIVHDVLYVGDDSNGVWIIHNASSANGAITPNRSITGNFTGNFGGMFQVHGLFVDTTRDLLYVSLTTFSSPTNVVMVFNNASTANGNSVTPVRTIDSYPSINAGAIYLDAANDRLYMADTSSNTVRVIDGASTANGTVASDRTIYIGASPANLTLDMANNRLYVLNPSRVYIVNGASTANGSVAMTAVLAPSGSILSAIAVKP